MKVLLRRHISALWLVNRRPAARRRVNYKARPNLDFFSQNTNLHYSLCCAELPLRTLMNNPG